MSNADTSREQLDPRDKPSVSPQEAPGVEERRVAAWIGKALVVHGKVISSEDLTINGQVEGTIELGQHTLTIGEGAAIKADLVARAITISGTVTGSVTATERVDLRATGEVNGDINAPRLHMAEGAIVRGKVDASRK
jgi:cytoskeletal protein CcmA (bactofilin family)